MNNNFSKFLVYSKEVQAAMEAGKPIVALESTIISHGMPYPQNVEMAKKVENIIREQGAVPATIALMDGYIKIGLEAEDIERLASEKPVAKVSRRDLAEVLALKKLGATTVATTMIGAHLAGIKFFVTGGIGGVHRGVEETMDISADLEELSRTPVTVICAGAKSILDLPRTLEYLETKGVPVIGYKTQVLPAFFTSESPYRLNSSVEDVDTLASIVKMSHDLELNAGVLVANPIPQEDAMSAEYIESIIQKATKEAEEKGVSGKDATPFLLAKIVELTGGASLKANIALVYNNAKVGASLAVAYAKLK